MIIAKLFITFVKIGLFTIGSGYSMLVLAQRYIVDTYHWLTLSGIYRFGIYFRGYPRSYYD